MNEQYTRAPHRRPQPGSGPSPNAALMIDFDNVTMAIRSNLGQELRNFLTSDIIRGKVSVQRAYADWRRYPQYIVPLSEASIDLIFAPAYGSSKKNATDIRLAIDCLELVFTRPEIGTYILLSGDSDFSSLVLKLKEYGKYVIGVGLQESTSDLLVQNCDEYYSYNSLSGLTSAEEMTAQSHDPWELVGTAVQRMEERDDVMRSDRLKQVMLEIDGGFDEKDHGFSKFNRFLAEASSRGLVRLRKMGDGQYEVAPDAGAEEQADGGPPARESAEQPQPAASDGGRTADRGGRGRESERGGQSRRKGGRGGRKKETASSPSPPPKIEASDLRSAYELIADVVADLADDGKPVRDSEVKREMLRRNSDFDEAALGFSKFSRFLRQARDEEVIDVEKDDDGNYHLAPAGRGAAPTSRPEPETPSEPRQPTRRERTTPSGADRDRAEAPPAEPEPAEEEPAVGTAGRPAAEAGAAEGSGPAETQEAGGTDTEEDEGRPAARRGMGRFRRGSRGPAPGAESSSDDGEGVPGPVGPVDEGDDEPSDEVEPSTPADDTTTSSDGTRRAGRGLGRFRRGQDGASAGEEEPEPSNGDGGPAMGPVDTAEPGDAGQEPAADADRPGDEAAGAPAGSAATGPATGDRDGGSGGDASDGAPAGEAAPVGSSDDPVEHMIGSYPGVGRKTAEKLVEAFGGEIFDVIDREPGRLTEVLPEHRAQAVIEARQVERERVGA